MAKPKTHEEAVALVESTKSTSKELRTELREFKSENKIKKDAIPEDAKLAKKLATLTEKADKAKAAVEEAQELEKELRPRKERISKYEYPEGMDDKDKKRYRAKMRRDAEAAANPDKAKKADKSEESEKPAKDKKAKKTIKKKAADVATPEEDED